MTDDTDRRPKPSVLVDQAALASAFESNEPDYYRSEVFWSAVYPVMVPALRRYAARLLRLRFGFCETDDAKEIATEAVARTYGCINGERIARLPSPIDRLKVFRTYLYTVCRRLTRQRAWQIAGTVQLDDKAACNPADQSTVLETNDPPDSTGSVTSKAVQQLLALLPPKDGHLLYLKHIEQLTYREIAQRLGGTVSETALRVRVHRAESKLREAIERRVVQQRSREHGR